MTAWAIRDAHAADAESLALIGAATFLETFVEVHTGAEIVDHCREEHSPDAYRRLFGKGAEAWLVVATATDAPLGYAVLAPPDLPGMQAGDLELKRIYLLSRLHGAGVADALLRQVAERAVSRGAKRMLLDVYSHNDRAIAFYARHGFRKIADNRFFVGATGYDDVVLARALGPSDEGR